MLNPRHLPGLSRKYFLKPSRTLFTRKKQKVDPKTPRMRFYRNVWYTFVGTGVALMYSRYAYNEVEIICAPTQANELLVAQNSIFTKRYTSTFYLPMTWMQVFYGALFEAPLPIDYDREILTLRDQEQIPLDWTPIDCNYESRDFDVDSEIPVTVVLTGITGNSRCNYVTHMVNELSKKGFRVVVAPYRYFFWEIINLEAGTDLW
jgi:hypothetical protein